MPRAKRGFKARRRRNRVLKAASGFRAGRRTMYRRAAEAVRHAWMHAYSGRKQKKRTMRRLWIVRINAAARQEGLSYSRMMDGCNKANIGLDRKVLAELAIVDPAGFGKVVETARAAL
ncbi:50S ribosomal protein L20 [Pseudenhygromyxa sp. WMMC2535]|uniref:50S ribosomal protein L20 n=1 Tax=Pseudenhygromyxa sp. WMMC2535 TaxID=2712867 RepID=UPI001556EB6D|nr:50S ribosomal protein L20 [Pseudenhygromyxa sp. WMMC2535]NVB41702.1 50S ribosomal protein L20 [Pseudenhygromyxa sp. WMMC2535]